MPPRNTRADECERLIFFADIIRFIYGTDRVFEKLELPPVSDNKPIFLPYFVTLERLARERCLETSGIEALRSFTEIWDGYCELMRARGKHPLDNVTEIAVGRLPFFSDSQVSLMLKSVSEYQDWLRRHFPAPYEYGHRVEKIST